MQRTHRQLQRTNDREQTTRRQIQTCKAFKQDRWPGDEGKHDAVPAAQHTQTMELSPGKSECPAHVLEDPVMVDELAVKTWVPF